MNTVLSRLRIIGFSMMSVAIFISLSSVGLAIGPYNRPKAQPAPNQSTVSVTGLTASLSTTTLSAVSTVTFSMTLGEALHAGSDIYIQGMSYSGNPDQGYAFNFSNATAPTGTTKQEEQQSSSFHLRLDQGTEWAAGAKTFILANVTNPSKDGSYLFNVSISDPQSGQPGQQPPSYQTNTLTLGTISVQGTVTLPDGTPAQNVQVSANPMTQNGGGQPGTYYGGQTNSSGQYSIFAMTNGKYQIQVFLPNDPNSDYKAYVAPDAVEVTYAGTTLTQNFALIVPASNIKATVVYKGTTTAVTTAQVFASKGMGGGSQCNVDSAGTCTIPVANGSWNVMINPQWDQQTQKQMSVDWTYNQPPVMLEVNNETKEVKFEVEKATATIKGTVKTAAGACPSNAQNMRVEARGNTGGGNGTQLSSTCTYEFKVSAGTYNMQIWAGENSSYYIKTTTVTIADNETKTQDLTLLEKNAKICGTVKNSSGTGLSGIRMNANMMQKDGGWSNGTSGSDGAYCVNVYVGEWEIRPDMNSGSNYIYAGKGVRQSITSDTQQVTGIDFTMITTDASLAPSIIDDAGNAVSNIWGWAYARPTTGANNAEYGTGLGGGGGAATIKLIAGTYQVGAWIDPNTGYLPGDEQTVTVGTGEIKAVVITILRSDATIRGYVLDNATGQPITNVMGFIFAQSEKNFTGMGTQLGKDGSYKLSVRSGNKYSMGYHMESSEYLSGGGPDGTLITVSTPGETVTHNFSADKANAFIKATVKDSSGGVMPYTFVMCQNFKYIEKTATPEKKNEKFLQGNTDSTGIANVGAVAGTYDCSAFAGGKGPGETAASDQIPPDFVKVEIAAGETKEITLQFKKADGSLSGTVTYPDGSKASMGFVHAWSANGGFSGSEVRDGSFSVPLSKGTWNVGADSMSQDRKFYMADEVEVVFTASATQNFALKEFEYGTIPDSKTFSFDNSSSGTTLEIEKLDKGSTQLIIPSQALGSECSSAQITASPNINLYKQVGAQPLAYGWDFDATCSGEAVTSFNSTVTLRLCYNEAILAGEGISEDDLAAQTFDETTNAWTSATGSQNQDINCMDLSLSHFSTYSVNSTTGNSNAQKALFGDTHSDIVVTPVSKGSPQVIVYDEKGTKVTSFYAYNKNLKAGVIAQTGDVNGDGNDEIVTVPAGGTKAEVKVFTSSGSLLYKFTPYKGFKKKINFTLYDLENNGNLNIITVPSEGLAATVKVFDYKGNVKKSFATYSKNYKGGALIQASDINDDGTDEIILAPIAESGQVRIYKETGKIYKAFHAYGSKFKDGIASLNVADIDPTAGTDEIIVTPQKGRGEVRIFTSAGKLRAKFSPFSKSFKGGSRALLAEMIDSSTGLEIIVMQNTGTSQTKIYDYTGKHLKYSFYAFSKSSRGSFNMATGDYDNDGSLEIAVGATEKMKPTVNIFSVKGTKENTFTAIKSSFRGGINLSNITAK